MGANDLDYCARMLPTTDDWRLNGCHVRSTGYFPAAKRQGYCTVHPLMLVGRALQLSWGPRSVGCCTEYQVVISQRVLQQPWVKTVFTLRSNGYNITVRTRTIVYQYPPIRLSICLLARPVRLVPFSFLASILRTSPAKAAS